MDTRFTREFECNGLFGSRRPSKFPLRFLTHNNVNNLRFIVLKPLVCRAIQVLLFFSSKKDENIELVNESDFDNDSQRFAARWLAENVGRVCHSFLSLSMASPSRPNGRGALRMQQ